ncbi:hypothetical protein BaRGS_00005914 [Batillaria attramentaria]|uniref:Uncharacterized protein n=1 Tax=Batillaria attramentaria TaxID=370345 RepID=A0ABD0LUQ1_9CAEN
MVQLSQKPLKVSDNIYQNIDRHVYVNVSQSRRRPQRDSVASPHSPNPSAAADNDDYDEPQPFPPRRPPKSHTSQASAPATRRQPPPINTSDDDDVYEPVDGEKHMHDPAKSSKTDAKRRSIKDGTSAGVPVLKDTSAAMTSELAKVLKKQRQNLEDIPESAASDTRHAAKPTVKNLLLRSKSSEHPDKPPSSTKPSKPAPAVAATLPRAQQASSKPASSQRSTEATYINQQEMAIVKPMGSMTFSQSSVASQSSKQHGPATVKPSPGFQQTPPLSPQGPETTAKLQQKTINDVGEVRNGEIRNGEIIIFLLLL